MHDELHGTQGRFHAIILCQRTSYKLFFFQDYVLSVAVSHDGQWVVSGSKDRGVQFWDSRTAIVQCMLQGHKNSGTCDRIIPLIFL